MSRDSMIRIKETEAEAERIIADAKSRAQKMLDEAEIAGKALCEATEAQVSAQMEQLLTEVRKKAASTTEKVLQDGEKEAAKMSDDVKLRRKIAEKLILRGLDAKCR